MGLRLVLLSWWTPRYIISRELDRVSELTTAALISLIEAHAPGSLVELAKEEERPSRTIEERRSAMARRHAALIKVLEAAAGRDRAVELGRGALFAVGQRLGREARDKLGVGDEPRDLVRAARILYRVLGIESGVELLGNGKARLIVDRCALSEEYSELTCSVLCATDEGVVRGLNPGVSMRFEERITSGRPRCIASIEFDRKGSGG